MAYVTSFPVHDQEESCKYVQWQRVAEMTANACTHDVIVWLDVTGGYIESFLPVNVS